MTNRILANLNPEQLSGVKHTQGPLLISAGAGSGKTRVLTHRIAYMIQHNHIQPYNILALTFTRNAANEMKGRITKLCGKIGDKVWASTFHTFGDHIMRQYADKLGYSRKFSIVGPSAQITLTRKILKHLNVDTKTYTPRTVHDSISGLKNNLTVPSVNLGEAQESGNTYDIIVAKTYTDYQHVLHHYECLDFDDLIMMPVLLFEHYPMILRACQDHFQYISVDEYQDTNKAQFVLLELLASHYHNICVVGDADQSIYGWRGANPGNIKSFLQDNPDAAKIRMNQNYRSTQNILKTANSVIKYNHKYDGTKGKKNLWTKNPKGARCVVYHAQTGTQEAEHIAHTISKEVNAHKLSYKDCAVLYRTNAQSRVLEETMLKDNIPYDIIGGITFYGRQEIKTELEYLESISNPYNEFALRQIIDFPRRGIGAHTIRNLTIFAGKYKLNLFTAMKRVTQNNSKLSKRSCIRLHDFHDMIANLSAEAATNTVTTMAKRVVKKSGYWHILARQSRTSKIATDRIDNLREFMSVTKQFDKNHSQKTGLLPTFLNQIMLELNADPNDKQSDNTVKLMTIHASKGQEYKHVFVTGLENSIFPTYKSLYDDDTLHEERRLMYVAITRAKSYLTLSYAKKRMLWGRVQFNNKSQFLKELNPSVIRYLTGPKIHYHSKPTKNDNQTFNEFF